MANLNLYWKRLREIQMEKEQANCEYKAVICANDEKKEVYKKEIEEMHSSSAESFKKLILLFVHPGRLPDRKYRFA
jgi:hypothetical protein